jgi:hypothetical protein
MKTTTGEKYTELTGLLDVDSDLTRDADADVLIQDITEETLLKEISQLTGKQYLSKVSELDSKQPLDVFKGNFFGPKSRIILPLAVNHKGNCRWVHFILDTGAPYTYLSPRVRILEYHE